METAWTGRNKDTFGTIKFGRSHSVVAHIHHHQKKSDVVSFAHGIDLPFMLLPKSKDKDAPNAATRPVPAVAEIHPITFSKHSSKSLHKAESKFIVQVFIKVPLLCE